MPEADKETEQPKVSSEIKDKPQAAPDLLYFNVMPKSQNNGQIVEPTVKSEVVNEEQDDKKEGFWEMVKKFKYYIIGLLAVIILIPGIYFGSSLLGSNMKTEDLLVKRTQTKSTPAANAEFATPKEWRDKYFPNCDSQASCGDNIDADKDGLKNIEEFKLTTDPNNPDSDQDGLADGDEINVFGSDPLKNHTTNNDKYSDLDYVKGAFNFKDDKKLDAAGINAVTAKMQSFGLHMPTIRSLDSILLSVYKFSSADVPSATPTQTPSSTSATSDNSGISGIDMSLAAKQDRDTKRSNAIKNIEIALVKYQIDNKVYPAGPDFETMFNEIKPYLKVATNGKDPINQDPYIYTYTASTDQKDFTLTFYSEVAAGPISKHAADAQKDANLQTAEVYDNQRKMDLEDLRTALLLYSNSNIAGNQMYVFPTKDKYKTSLVPDYISAIPKDPLTGKDYEYQPSGTFDAFTLKAVLQNPPAGNTGYLCNQVDECDYY